MSPMQIETLVELIGALVAGNGTWKEKRDAVLTKCSDMDKTNLDEFCSWFEEAKE